MVSRLAHTTSSVTRRLARYGAHHLRRVKHTLLSLTTYSGAATAVLAHEQPLSALNLLSPQTPQDLVAVLGLAVATVSLALNAYLRWQALRVARAALAQQERATRRLQAGQEAEPHD